MQHVAWPWFSRFIVLLDSAWTLEIGLDLKKDILNAIKKDIDIP